MTCRERGSWLDSVEDQLATWLRQRKGWDIDVRVDGRQTNRERLLDVRHHQDATSRSVHARLTEPVTKTGTWTTELIAHERSAGGGWISLDVDNSDGHFVDVPALARYLMQVLPLADGELRFSDGPQIFHAHQGEDVMELLCDEDRHGLVFVAGTDPHGLPFDRFVAAVQRWTRQVYGLAQVVVLDPAATETLTAEFGPQHGVRPWSLRTYLPGVDPAVAVDSRRHRVLGTASLAEMPDGRVQKVLGRAARNHAAGRPVPAEVQRVRRIFERLANQAIVDAIAEETSSPDASPGRQQAVAGTPSPVLPEHAAPEVNVAAAAERYLAQIELVRSILGVESLDEAALRRLAASATAPRTDPAAITRAAEQIRVQQTRIEALEDQVVDLKRALDDERLEHAVTAEALEKRDDETRWLRGRLHERGDYTTAFAPVPADAATVYPESFQDLLHRLADMCDRGVVFSGNPGHAIALDDVDLLGKCLHTAWDAILTLADYVRARNDGTCQHGVKHYIEHTPSGYRQMAPAKFAATETAVTMRQFGGERVFPVPRTVDPTGKAAMKAHFKLGRIGMVSPRLYYLDDYSTSGTVVVGYIGRHLTNTQTN